ncbi:MAG: HAMP domain-containing sensor histidine kinase [Bacteroidales bacterium]
MGNSTHRDLLKGIISDPVARKFIIDLINSLPNIVVVLDDQRRLIYSNRAMIDKLSLDNYESAFHLKPGELFQCVNARSAPGRCGSSEACELCGALRTIEDSRMKKSSFTSDYRILGSNNGLTRSYNFRLTSTPFQYNDNSFFLVSLEDVSALKRKEELERIFFHDVMNSIGSLHGIINLLKNQGDIHPNHLDILESTYNNLYDTIREQKQLSQAEQGELTVNREELHVHDLIIETTMPFKAIRKYKMAIEIAKDTVDQMFFSDGVLLSRVLTNMIKNAVEASGENDTITIGASLMDQHLRFWVRNPAVIPHDTGLQIFERSFTTKGPGRGMGTFSMKLLGEHYLGGKVDFNSSENEGTTFWIDLPLSSVLPENNSK